MTRRFPLWTLLGVALAGALVVGSGVLSSAPPTRAQRAYAIESVLRCPSCEDLSVADSTAPTAQAVRATVDRMLAAGRTDQQIESYLEDRYGSAIVLDPPGRGWPLLVWVLPLAGGGLAVALLGAFLYRRRSAASAGPDLETAPRPSGRGELEEQRRFLLASLSDSDAEYLAGDLDEGDYLALRRRDLVRLRSVEAELDRAASAAQAVDAPAAARPSMPRRLSPPTKPRRPRPLRAGLPVPSNPSPAPPPPPRPPGGRRASPSSAGRPAGDAGSSAGRPCPSPPPSSWRSRCSPPTGCRARARPAP